MISRWIGEKKLYLSFMTLAGAGCLSLAFVPKGREKTILAGSLEVEFILALDR